MNANHIGVFAVIAFFLLIVWIDDRRGKKAQKLNSLGLCARCGKSLGCSSELITISGSSYSSRSGFACHKCASIVRLQYRILFSLLFLGFAATMIFVFWSNRA